MRKRFLAGVLGASCLAATGCTYITAVRSVQSKAYVVKASPWGGSFWNCDATSGEPICYQVSEVPQEASK